MGSYIRDEDGFEYRYRGAPCLCDLEVEAEVGNTEIFPQLVFSGVDNGEDLVCLLNGDNDCIPVDENETPFETFRDFFLSIKKYFENADTKALVEILEDENGNDDERSLLRMINAAEQVELTAGCTFTLLKEEWPDMLDWINENLESTDALTMADMRDEKRIAPAVEELTGAAVKEDDELPLLSLLILRNAMRKDVDEYVVHDVDEVWTTPVIQDGEVVTPDTEIGEDDDYMF